MRITLYLLREGVKFDRSFLRDDGDKFKEITVTAPSTANTRWRLFYQPRQARPASWVENVQSIVANPHELSGITTQSSSAVLLVETANRRFAVTFGHGYHAVHPRCIVPGFGLRVTANVVAKNQITSADTKGFNQSSRSQKTILPAADEFYALGVEPSEEWVRQLSGRVLDNSFASTAAGADSLRLSIRDFTMPKLPAKLGEIAARYQQMDYKDSFGFLDNFIRIDKKDPMVEELDKKLDQLVAAKDSSVAFAAPDPFEQLHVDHYRLQYYKAFDTEELDTAEVYDILGQLRATKNPLRRVKVSALDAGHEDVDKQYPLYDYVQVEIDHNDSRYALTSGAWFRINADYLTEVDDFVASIDDATNRLKLRAWSTSELSKASKADKAEGLYNKNQAEVSGWRVLDKKDLYFGQYRKIEICDLLTPDKELVCVKHASRSSTLSHLFAQGSVSAKLMHEEKYQERIMENLQSFDSRAEYGDRGSWTFVYAIAIAKPGKLADALFFFSKVNLMTNTREIEGLGYKVALAKIEVMA